MSAPLICIPEVPLTEAYWRERGAFLARQAEQVGPIFRSRMARTEVVFMIGPQANRLVMADRRHAFSHRLGWGWAFGQSESPPNLFTLDGAEHRRLRRAIHPAFSARAMARYLPTIAQAIEKRVSRWEQRGTIDIYEEARVISFDLAVELFLGVRPGPEMELCRAVFLHGAHRRSGESVALLRDKIAERRVVSADDALGLLVQAADADGRPLADEQLLAHANALLVAAHETSSSLAAWAFYLLVGHPDYERRVLEELAAVAPDGAPTLEALGEMRLLEQALSEAERLYPPVPVAPRGLLEDVTAFGYGLPAGTLVYYSAEATHLLPAIWTAPTLFDPDRFAPPRREHRAIPYVLVGFGGGPRVCIGRALARTELLLLLAAALRRYRLTLVPGQTIVQRYGVTNRPRHGIRLYVQRRLLC